MVDPVYTFHGIQWSVVIDFLIELNFYKAHKKLAQHLVQVVCFVHKENEVKRGREIN
jgi:hypothetical protein